LHLSPEAAQEVADLREENKKLRSGFFKPSDVQEPTQKKN